MATKSTKITAGQEVRKWVPVPSGKIYCSPACGYGCTKAEWVRAKHDAGVLARTMGDGFVPRVWENLGWHYCVTKNFNTGKQAQACEVRIYPPSGDGTHGDGTYSVFLNVSPQIITNDRDPRKALAEAKSMYANVVVAHVRTAYALGLSIHA